jgi:hypothetical protein
VVDGNASGSIKDLNVPAWYMIKYAFGGKDRTYKHNIVVKKHADRLINGTSVTLTLDAKTGDVLAVATGPATGPAPAPPANPPGASVGASTTITPAAQNATGDVKAQAKMPGPVAASVTPAAREAALRVAAALTKK